MPAPKLCSHDVLHDHDLTYDPYRRGPPEQLTEEGEGHIFYYVYEMNNWREILLDQCTKMIYSGLYEAATAIYCAISRPPQEVQLQRWLSEQHAFASRLQQENGNCTRWIMMRC